ncbi:alpha/beta fold hydrolase [Paraburkholderia azotifigens]
MPFIEIGGQPLHYRTAGEEFPVLMGHSYQWGSSMWAPQIDALSRHYKVIVPDLRGHGQSGGLPENTHHFGDLTTHVRRLLARDWAHPVWPWGYVTGSSHLVEGNHAGCMKGLRNGPVARRPRAFPSIVVLMLY